MNPADIPKTAITTPFGLFEFTRMTFGMRNAGNTFQRLIDRTLSGLENASPYLDDILVFSKTEEDHRRHLQETFTRLRAAHLMQPTHRSMSSGKPASSSWATPSPPVASHHCRAEWQPSPPTPNPTPSRSCRTFWG